MELGARKAYPRESGLAELHVLNSAETLAQELGRTETVAALAATWLAASEVGMRVLGRQRAYCIRLVSWAATVAGERAEPLVLLG